MEKYFDGKSLYGNDFSLERIKEWFDAESEGYAELEYTNSSKSFYTHHHVNKIHGFNKIKKDRFENVLGFGSAWGLEFEQIISKISSLTIIEPSEKLTSTKIGHLTPVYVKPTVEGKLLFTDNSFDLITCFGTLHHIPNVSFVLSELIRVLKPSGHLLIREPITSMGNWNFPRHGLTKNERGISVCIFESIFSKEPVTIVHKGYCFTLTYFFQKTIGKLFKSSLTTYKFYVLFDKLVSSLLKKNVRYHATKKIERIAPSSIFYVIQKLPPK